jgi:hypothetical protein
MEKQATIKNNSEIFAEYHAASYKTLLQDHKPATIPQGWSWSLLKLFLSIRKPLAAFLRLQNQ